MNKKGQALVEFIIILPVFLMLVFCIVDFSRVVTLKNELESKTSDVIELYETGKSKDEIISIIADSDLKIDIFDEDDYETITLNKNIKPITPGLNHLSDKIFNVETKRIIKKDINIVEEKLNE